MPANDRAANFGGLFESATQDFADRFSRNKVLRKTHEVQSGNWTPTHRENIRKRVGGGDLAVGERVVHNWREEIHGLHERAQSIDPIHAGVVERARVNENV